MEITYTQQYTEHKFQNFTLYENLHLNSTNVFWEYYNLCKRIIFATEEQLREGIKNYRPEAKSKLRISYNDNQIEFFKTNKYVFPVFYIIFK